MPLSARKTKSADMDLPEVGKHIARLVGLVDLGHQPKWTYEGRTYEDKWKIQFVYELVNSKMKDGKPHWISEDINSNDYEDKGKKSTMMTRVRDLEREHNETDNGIHLDKLLGAPCVVTVELNQKGYTTLKGQNAVSGLPPGFDVPLLENKIFSFDMDEPDLEVWNRLSNFTQQKIKGALNFPDSKLDELLKEEESDKEEDKY